MTPGVQEWIDRKLGELAQEQPGARSNAAYRVAFAIGGLADCGGFEPEQVADPIVIAALKTGLDEDRARGAVRRGLVAGADRQWELPGKGTNRYARGRLKPPRKRLRKTPQAPEPEYPDPREIRSFLRKCVHVTQHPDVGAWLRRRGIDPQRVAELHLAYAIPSGMQLPRWARLKGQGWTQTGHLLAVPMFDPAGRLRSLLARYVGGSSSVTKSAAPAEFSRSGLLMADAGTRDMLRGESPCPFVDPSLPLRITIAEGEPDYLWCAAHGVLPKDRAGQEELATVGIVSGSWSRRVAKKTPPNSTMVIATDADGAGQRYAKEIEKTLPASVNVLRTCAEQQNA